MNDRLGQLLRTYGYNKIDPSVPFGIAQEYQRQGNGSDAHHFYGVVYRDYKPYLPNFVPYVTSLLSQGERDEALKVAQEGMSLAEEQKEYVVAEQLRNVIAGLD